MSLRLDHSNGGLPGCHWNIYTGYLRADEMDKTMVRIQFTDCFLRSTIAREHDNGDDDDGDDDDDDDDDDDG